MLPKKVGHVRGTYPESSRPGPHGFCFIVIFSKEASKGPALYDVRA